MADLHTALLAARVHTSFHVFALPRDGVAGRAEMMIIDEDCGLGRFGNFTAPLGFQLPVSFTSPNSINLPG